MQKAPMAFLNQISEKIRLGYWVPSVKLKPARLIIIESNPNGCVSTTSILDNTHITFQQIRNIGRVTVKEKFVLYPLLVAVEWRLSLLHIT